ncbi:PQQ-dependent sugar dehydrogenase [Pontibacter diazotrophicus]|uniref:PQQ-dependent sugar dehydrogenase n=1 Tax=Pontibacter diazotrophicus TaxID=1400979 RepID=A0A3D8LGB6_9BACT|nr:PQQ-dependent sugar dehydrogenase [Pontibacter diazotrophicus]RDV15942.1 PQQ-dependent sugar dehydrogenase [Pontibacter diazotrophicus]
MKTAGGKLIARAIRRTTGALAFVLITIQAFSQEKPTVRTEAGDIEIEELAGDLKHPWGMAFLPDNRLLVTERAGNLRILDTDNNLSQPLKGTPEVFVSDQGGLLDVALDPDFRQNNLVYLSFSEPGEDSTASTALGRGKLEGNELKDFKVIFRQDPKVEGPNHFGGRILFTQEGHLMLTMADRFKFEPAQDLSNHMGTIIRINRDGTVPKDNPFVGQANAKDEIWSYGHRNIESAAFDPRTNKLWVAEMGPMGGDELNQPVKGRNYGWPVVSWGKNYDGTDIPNPPTHPEFANSVIEWTPTISPSGMIFYTGSMFPAWQNSAFIGGLTSSGLVRVQINGEQAEEVERIPLAVRTRDVEQAPDGSLYVLTDYDNGKILRLHLLK